MRVIIGCALGSKDGCSMSLSAIVLSVRRLPKPAFFALCGALGCSAGWVLGEPVLSAARPAGDAAGSDAGPQIMVFGPEFNRRLDREGAQSGEIQISLMWDNVNDLDLFCVEPDGNVISYRDKKSASGGQLDVDMNVIPPRSTEPVENIYWGRGAPRGKYRVGVDHYENHGGRDPSTYKVAVKHGDVVQEFGGALDHDERVLVYDFVHGEAVDPPVEAATLADAARSVAYVGVWASLLAVALGVALTVSQNVLMRRTALSGRQIKPMLFGGVAAGFAAGGLGQGLFTVVSGAAWLVAIGRCLGWVALGGVLGLGMSMLIPNLPRAKACGGGLAGGLVGGVAFSVSASLMPDVVARLAGSAILGASIGMMIAVAETYARRAWLVVHWGPHEQAVVNLGERPIHFGSAHDADVCLSADDGFLPMAAAYTLEKGVVEFEDVARSKKTTLRHGSTVSLGSLKVEVQVDQDRMP
jgi:hypothetical protein